jgi:hypothetical protein
MPGMKVATQTVVGSYQKVAPATVKRMIDVIDVIYDTFSSIHNMYPVDSNQATYDARTRSTHSHHITVHRIPDITPKPNVNDQFFS